VTRAWGLKRQILTGLAVILVVSFLSAGVVGQWILKQELTELQLSQARVLGPAVATVLAAVVDDRNRLQRVAAELVDGPTILQVEIYDRHRRLLIAAQAGGGVMPTAPSRAASIAPELTRALGTGNLATAIREGEPPILDFFVPMVHKGRLWGVAKVALPLLGGRAGYRRVVVTLMGLNILVLLLFVALVVNRYVLRPIEAMGQAANQVAEGDLSVRLDQSGAAELSSVAQSFNQMTDALRTKITELEEQRQQIIRSEKLASVGRLATGIAHEIGNPLQSIIGFADLLKNQELDKDTSREFLGRLDSEAQRIHETIRQLLDYSRPVTDETSSVDLAEVVESALLLVLPQPRFRDVKLSKVGLDGLPPIRGNAQRLSQVLVNLLLNAADAMETGGVIEIQGEALDESGRTFVFLRVVNDGPAIPIESREKIFDPFFSTKDPGQGTGLGLAVCRSIVESYGGELYLAERTTEYNSGAEFVLRFPR
jgi:two-component system, NtrC family, sensor kinase